MKTIHKLFASLLFISFIYGAAYAQVNSSCIVEVPKDWTIGTSRWDGKCLSGKADGLGVLKEIKDFKVNRIFFGKVDNGIIQIGVIEVPEQGFIAGNFKNGSIVSSDNRQTYIDAFNIASLAAKANAEQYANIKNYAASKLYEEKAKNLKEQLD